jgi:ABC-type Fe3+/spermidine/putrescine transport system ATPase subunit
VPADYESRLVKMDFKVAADSRPARPRRVEQALQREVEPKKVRMTPALPAALPPRGRAGGVAAAMTEYLRLQGIRKSFGTFQALSDIDLTIEQGEFVCFLGPSGCGKTTLLRICRRPGDADRGRHLPGRARHLVLPPAERDYGIVFQSYALFPNLSVADNVAYGLVNRKVPKATIAARVEELLKLVGLPGSGAKFPAQLSGGQQQRIALARALATSPGLLLLDEPLSALDAIVRVHLRQEIRSLQRKLGVTTIMVTHDQEEALSVADRIVVMNHGVIEQVGTPMEVYRDPATPFVADFVGKINVLTGGCTRGATCASAPAASPASATPTPSATSRSTCAPRTCSPGRSPPATSTSSTARSTRSSSSAPTAWCGSTPRRWAASRSPSTCRSTTSPSRAWRSAAGCR